MLMKRTCCLTRRCLTFGSPTPATFAASRAKLDDNLQLQTETHFRWPFATRTLATAETNSRAACRQRTPQSSALCLLPDIRCRRLGTLAAVAVALFGSTRWWPSIVAAVEAAVAAVALE